MPSSRRHLRVPTLLTGAVLVTSACSGAAGPGATGGPSTTAPDRSWDEVLAEADGQTVDLWMYGGDQLGNAYVDDVLAPAAAGLGVTLRRVPVTDTADALNRVLSELQAGTDDGSVDLVWVNGENFASGRQADAWLCGWTDQLPSMAYVDPEDPLLTSDFGTPVDGCEAPWHKAQFVLAYDSAAVTDPPSSMTELFAWVEANPGRFTYPAPPDFTGSAFLRQALYAVAGGPDEVPAEFDQAAFDELAPELFDRLAALAPSLWRAGDTYPQDLAALEELYAGDQVDVTMTYGPATLAQQVASGALPAGTRVLPLEGGTLGNASFLAVPVNAADQAGALAVADLALTPEQQLAKADPAVWGQYPVLAPDRLPGDVAAAFAALPSSEAVPPFEELSRDADPELGAGWVGPLEDGWRSDVLGAG
ncbi:putative spermidine/putrescine transport system substrate-binding protein [Geodermatophilus bullaregiensis]|uniref:ABC transporter substrate-binding protein n=1 Tax=Geodermatophilus bullaregiensis TaxID=1564160 RepID=UPI0027DC9908|nr:ABC transporter substrate-binding protein [Geodermatophilus bullaregiensis]MBM7808846.1 putative spermidine/putrescine transport system substrate-binding protein [Geodermatophilus bullaregiensis]